MLVTTVDDNKSKYTAHMYSQALLTRKIQTMIGYPSTHDFLQIINCKLLLNCPVTRANILVAEDIFGPNIHSLNKGKTVQWTEAHVASSVTPVLSDIFSLYHSVTLCVNIMFINKMPFLITISCNIKFSMVELLLNQLEDMVAKSLMAVMHLYHSHSFLVQMVHADSKLEVLHGPLARAGSGLNV